MQWMVFIVMAAVSCYGFYSRHLFAQNLWDPQGLMRLELLAGCYAALVSVLYFFRPRWLGPALIAIATLGTVSAIGFTGPATVLLFLASSIALGDLLLRRAGSRDALYWLLALELGSLLYAAAIGFAVHRRVNYPIVYLAIFTLPIVSNFRALRELSRRLRWTTCAFGGVALLGFVLMAHWLIVLAPEVGGDGLAMHLAVPARIAFDHRWTFDVRNLIWAVMPMGGDWAFTAVYLTGGEYAARLLNFAMLLFNVAMVVVLTGRWFPAALFASTPIVLTVTGSLMVENFWCAALLSALAAVNRFSETRQATYAYAAAAFLGGALSIKFGALAFVLPIAIALIVSARPCKLRWAAVCAIFFALALPPYVNAWMRTGNPFFPFMNATFKSPDFDSQENFRDSRYRRGLHWDSLYRVTYATRDYMEGQDGAFGFQYLLLLPLALFAWRSGGLYLAVALAGSAAVFQGASYARYMYPAFPLCCIAFGFVLDRPRGAFPRTIAAACVVCVLLNVYFWPASGWYHHEFYLNPWFRPVEIDGYIGRHAPQRKLIAYLNLKREEGTVAFLEGDAIAGLNSPVVSNTWHCWPFYRRMQDARSVDDVARAMHDFGARVFVVPPPNIGAPLLHDFARDRTVTEFSIDGWSVAHLKD